MSPHLASLLKLDATAVAGVDIDGVLADPTHRLHHLSKQPRNWRGFFSESKDDLPLAVGIDLVHELIAEDLSIVYVSGRPEGLREDTLDWFARYEVPKAPLLLRPYQNYTTAPEWKLDIYTKIRSQHDVRIVVDDDLRVVERLRQADFNVRHADWYRPPAEDSSRLAQAQDELGRT